MKFYNHSFFSNIVIVLFVLLSLSACSKPKNKDLQTTSQKPSEVSTVKTPAPPAVNNIKDAPPKPKEITATSEILNAPLYSDIIQVGDTIVKLPAKYSDFISAGATLFDNRDMTEDYLVDAGKSKIVTMIVANTVFKLDMKNTTEEIQALKNTDVLYICSTEGSEIFYPLGIKVGDSLSDLTDKWGQPSVDNSGSSNVPYNALGYSYLEYPFNSARFGGRIKGAPVFASDIISATGFNYNVTIDMNTSKITNITCTWVDKSRQHDIVDFTKGDLSYKLPFVFTQKDVYGRDITKTTYVFDSIPYVVLMTRGSIETENDKEVTDENLINAVNNTRKYESVKYEEIEVVNNNGVSGAAIGYISSNEAVKCKVIYMNGTHLYDFTETMIIPLDETVDLTDEAIVEFKKLMFDFADSIKRKD